MTLKLVQIRVPGNSGSSPFLSPGAHARICSPKGEEGSQVINYPQCWPYLCTPTPFETGGSKEGRLKSSLLEYKLEEKEFVFFKNSVTRTEHRTGPDT
jgi:hypothetical protein